MVLAIDPNFQQAIPSIPLFAEGSLTVAIGVIRLMWIQIVIIGCSIAAAINKYIIVGLNIT